MSKINSDFFKEIINFCDEYYTARQNEETKCSICNHEKQKCPGSCQECLNELMYKDKNGRINYDCDKLLAFYVCKFLNRFVSEIYYLLQDEMVLDALNKFEEFNVLSFGCGPATDLIALDAFIRKYREGPANIRYTGIDIAKNYRNIHTKVSDLSEYYGYSKPKFIYDNIIDNISKYKFNNKNMIILQNIFSALDKINKRDAVNRFLDNLVDAIIKLSKDSIILINDINHFNMYRDEWIEIPQLIEKYRSCESKIMYFSDYHCYNWIQHLNNSAIFCFPEQFDVYKYDYWNKCKSVQLFIKLGD